VCRDERPVCCQSETSNHVRRPDTAAREDRECRAGRPWQVRATSVAYDTSNTRMLRTRRQLQIAARRGRTQTISHSEHQPAGELQVWRAECEPLARLPKNKKPSRNQKRGGPPAQAENERFQGFCTAYGAPPTSQKGVSAAPYYFRPVMSALSDVQQVRHREVVRWNHPAENRDEYSPTLRGR